MTYVLALLSIIIISLVLTDIASGVCVNNLSCRAIHAEVNNRKNGLFDHTFSKRVNANSKECCDSKNKDCWTGTAADALYWVDCDTDRKKSSSGQTVVACSTCDINVDDSGTITVTDEKEPKRTRAVYLCKMK